MSRIAYVNGAYLPHEDAFVHIEDRGYQFADGIYEYIAFYNRILLDVDLHLKRLERSLKELRIAAPMSMHAMHMVMRELMERSGRLHGGLYVQITRGVARRDHPFPAHAKPSLVMTVCTPKTPKPQEVEKGVSVITQPDIRWGRCDVKSISLLANILAKQEAASAKAREAWLLCPDGTVTEGAASNAYIVLEGEGVVTHPLNEHILGGVTRDVLLRLARKARIPVNERAFNITEARSAQEAFITSTSANVLPVTKLDGKPVGSGKPGPVTRKLLELYLAYVEEQTGYAL